jgi:hypothetical protein
MTPEMSEPTATSSFEVEIAGLVRGVELAGRATVTLEPTGLVVARESGQQVLSFSSLDGVVLGEREVDLYLASGDVLQLRGSEEVLALGVELCARLRSIPELTHSLRAFGSAQAPPGGEQVRFFEPFLEARRRAELGGSDEARQAFDASALRAAVSRRIRDIADRRYPDDLPERRALEAEMSEHAEPLNRRFAALEEMSRALDASSASEELLHWRRWTSALADVYREADEAWSSLADVLRKPDHRPSSRRGVFRWLKPRS